MSPGSLRRTSRKTAETPPPYTVTVPSSVFRVRRPSVTFTLEPYGIGRPDAVPPAVHEHFARRRARWRAQGRRWRLRRGALGDRPRRRRDRASGRDDVHDVARRLPRRRERRCRARVETQHEIDPGDLCLARIEPAVTGHSDGVFHGERHRGQRRRRRARASCPRGLEAPRVVERVAADVPRERGGHPVARIREGRRVVRDLEACDVAGPCSRHALSRGRAEQCRLPRARSVCEAPGHGSTLQRRVSGYPPATAAVTPASASAACAAASRASGTRYGEQDT